MRYVETTRVSLDSLRPYPGNARVHDDAALDESVGVNGQYRSVVARRLDDHGLQLLAGHGTVDAFARRGDTDVRVEVIEADDTEARRIVLADNATSRNAGYDEKLLLELIDQASKDGGLPGTGWDEAAYRELLDTFGDGFELDGDPDDFAVEPPADPVSQVGDVWVLGYHRLVCGDATDTAAWGSLLRGEKVDAVWTDPPYGVSYVGKTKDALTIKNDALDIPGLRRLLDSAFAQALDHCTPGAAWYVAAPAGLQGLSFADALRDLKILRQQIIWAKDVFVMGHSDYHYKHEPIYYGYAPGYTGRRGRGGDGWYGNNAQDTLWEVPRPKRSEEHPTMKPVELVARALRNSTRGRGLVADMFGGSGTTLVAAEVEGRSARLIELDPAYCDVICRRFEDLTGTLPVLESTGRAWDFSAEPPCEVPVGAILPVS